MILQVGAGTGLLYLVRWFWWRINAWCEVVAMVSSFVVSMVLLLLTRAGHPLSTSRGLVVTVIATTLAWVATAYLAPATDRETLVAFYRKVRPLGPGWTPIREAAGITEAEATVSARGDNIPLALLGWVAGCTLIWSALFTVGNFLYGRTAVALGLLAVFAASGLVVIRVVTRLWRDASD